MSDFVVDLALRGSMLLLLATLADLGLRRASAATRSLLWNTTVVLALLLPLAGWLLPAWELPVLPASWQTAPSSESITASSEAPSDSIDSRGRWLQASGRRYGRSLTGAPEHPEGFAAPPAVLARHHETGSVPAHEPPAGGAAAGSENRAIEPLPWLALSWSLGVALLLVHLIAAVSRVAWMERRAETVSDRTLIERLGRAANRLGVERPVRLLETSALRVPVTWELTTACILVPRQMTSWPAERQQTVLLHEMAHIRRQDCRFQLLAYLVVALHWFNPLAWHALRRLRVERERACDDAVVFAGVRPSDYAAHLLEIARSCRVGRQQMVAAVAMAWPSQLTVRVRAILDPTNGRRSPDRRTHVSLLAIAMIFVAPLAAIQPVAAAAPTPTPAPAVAPAATALPAGQPGSEPVAAAAPAATPAVAQEPTLEQLVQMRIHGVSPEYIEGMTRVMGRAPGIAQLIQFRIHGVSEELVSSMRDAFGAGIDLDDVVQARIHGASPEYARRMSEILGSDLDLDRLIQFRIHGVSPDYVASMRAAFGDVSPQELVSGRIHGVSADFAQQMRDLVDGTLDFEDLQQMRIHGVTVDLVKKLREAGYDDLSAEELVDIRIHGMDRVMLRRKGDGR